MSANENRIWRRVGLVGCAAAVLSVSLLRADGSSKSLALRTLRNLEGYRSAPILELPNRGAGYVTPKSTLDASGFSEAELRSALTATSEDKYVDVGRFQGLRRD